MQVIDIDVRFGILSKLIDKYNIIGTWGDK